MVGEQQALQVAVPVVPQTEKAFQQWIVKRARRWGWSTNHVFAARFMSGRYGTTTTHKGFPDLALWLPAGDGYEGRVAFLEVKGADARLDRYPEQAATIVELQRVGGNVSAYFVRPKDWADVEVLLRAGRDDDWRDK